MMLLALVLLIICVATYALVKLAGARQVLIDLTDDTGQPGDSGVDILGPASTWRPDWHPADDGFGADLYDPPPATHQRAAGHPRSALYVRPCARSTKGRHTR